MKRRSRSRHESGKADYVILVSLVALCLIGSVKAFSIAAQKKITCGFSEAMADETFLFTSHGLKHLTEKDKKDLCLASTGNSGDDKKVGGGGGTGGEIS